MVAELVDRALMSSGQQAEMSLTAMRASTAGNEKSRAQTTIDQEISVKAFAAKLKALADVTQESSSSSLHVTTDLKGLTEVSLVRRLSKQEHFATPAQVSPRMSTITKFGAVAVDDPFVRVNGLITDSMSSVNRQRWNYQDREILFHINRNKSLWLRKTEDMTNEKHTSFF